MWVGGARVILPKTSGGEPRILLVCQRHENRDIWMPPGGGVEDGESSKDAAAREVLEETGLVVRVGRLLWHVEEVSEKRGQRFVNFFLAEIVGGRLGLGTDPELGGEQVLNNLRFMSKKEMAKTEHVYPNYLRDEVWAELIATPRDPYRTRE